jgi:ATP-binding cassette subfamily C protein LapB
VGQDADLFSGTIRDNLRIGSADAPDAALFAAVEKSGADHFLTRDAMGYGRLVGERGSRLSGGQRTFLTLARALVGPSRLLFLDEPTGAMDTQTEQLFIQKLEKALEPGQTLVVSTHRHAMLALVDRLIVVDQGRIIADGPKDKILGVLSAA